MKVALLSLAAGIFLRPAPAHVLHTSNIEAFGGLLAAVREGESKCAEYVGAALRELEASYTHVQVPHVLQGTCARGTFFHAFKTEEECTAMTEKLVEAFKAGGPYDEWCAEVKKMVDAQSACECIALPQNGSHIEDGKAKSTSGTLYAMDYGAECKAHDLSTDACSGDYKAAWCYEKWCYVSEDCKAADVKKSFFFGEELALKYSYNNCGGMDAFAGEACAKQEESTCESFSENCAWNKPTGACQNKLCQCTGSNGGMNVSKHGFDEGYGETCKAWDKGSCAQYESMGDGYVLGLWCCKDWCYVPEECPSAEPSAVGADLFYSYFACPDDAEELAACEWKDPIDFGGEPVPLSSDAAKAVEEAVEEAPTTAAPA